MHKRKYFFVAGVFVCALAIIVFRYARNVNDVTVLRIYDSFPNPTQIGEFAKESDFITQKLKHITFSFVPANSMRLLDVLKNVKTGIIDAAITGLYFWGPQDPTLYLVSATPFAYNGFYQLQFLHSAHGKELYDQLGKRHNIVIIPCGITGIQICGWWKSPPTSVRDLKNKKIRIAGLAGEIFKRLGAITRYDIPVNDLHNALRNGELDAVEWSSPSDDLQQKFYQITPHAMIPGWHEAGTILQLIINRDKWNTLSITKQEEIRQACEYSFIKLASAYPILDGKALRELKKLGVQFHQWDSIFLKRFYDELQQIIAPFHQDPLFEQFYQAISLNTIAFNQHYLMQINPLITFAQKVKP